MNSFKALISKKGTILSITEEDKEITEEPKIDVTSGSEYPDTIIVIADGKAEAEHKVELVLKTWTQTEQNERS